MDEQTITNRIRTSYGPAFDQDYNPVLTLDALVGIDIELLPLNFEVMRFLAEIDLVQRRSADSLYTSLESDRKLPSSTPQYLVDILSQRAKGAVEPFLERFFGEGYNVHSNSAVGLFQSFIHPSVQNVYVFALFIKGAGIFSPEHKNVYHEILRESLLPKPILEGVPETLPLEARNYYKNYATTLRFREQLLEAIQTLNERLRTGTLQPIPQELLRTNTGLPIATEVTVDWFIRQRMTDAQKALHAEIGPYFYNRKEEQ